MCLSHVLFLLFPAICLLLFVSEKCFCVFFPLRPATFSPKHITVGPLCTVFFKNMSPTIPHFGSNRLGVKSFFFFFLHLFEQSSFVKCLGLSSIQHLRCQSRQESCKALKTLAVNSRLHLTAEVDRVKTTNRRVLHLRQVPLCPPQGCRRLPLVVERKLFARRINLTGTPWITKCSGLLSGLL